MTTDVAMAVTAVDDTTYTYDRPQGTTAGLVIASSNSRASQLIFVIVLNSISFVAFVPNLAMLIYLLAYKQAAKKTVNIFISNQIVLDLVASFFGIVKFALQLSGYTQTKTGVLRNSMIV